MNKIYVALSSFSDFSFEPKTLLESHGYQIIYNETGKRLTKDQLLSLDADISGFIAGLELYDKDVLNYFGQLKCISRCGVGIDNVDLDVAKEKGIVVCNTPDEIIKPVAELTLGLILDLLRQISAHSDLVKQGNWRRLGGHLLSAQTVGFIGAGRIGKSVAELCRAFGAQVLAYDLYPNYNWAEAAQITYCSLAELYKSSDIISLHLSGDADTDFCLDKDDFSEMKKGAYIVNTSRGKFINEHDLYEQLQSGYLNGAALDVFDNEPYAGPLQECPNVILTPHIGSLTQESRHYMELKTVQNLIDQLQSI